MPNLTVIKSSFAGGEWDPQMQADINLAKYATANKVMRNFFSHVNGTTSNRQGTIFLGKTKFSTTVQTDVKNTKLIPFQFSTSQAYMLEFGDFYIRFWKNGAPILSGGNPYEIATSYSQSAVMQLGYTQSNDTIFIAHPNYQPQILQRFTDAQWTISNYIFSGGPFQLDNTNDTYNLMAGFFTSASTSVSNVTIVTGGGAYSGGDIITIVQSGATIPATFRVINTQGGALYNGGIVLVNGGSGYSSASGLATVDLTTGGSGATVAITVGNIGGNTIIPVNSSVTLTATGFSPFVSGHIGSLWELFHYVPNQSLITTLTGNGSTSSISCGGTYRLITNGTWTSSIKVEKSVDGGITWLALNTFSSVDNFNANTFGTEDISNNAPPFLVRVTAVNFTSGTIDITLTADPYIQPGIISITSVQSSSIAHGLVQQPIGLSNTNTSDWAEGAWSNYRGWPSVVEFTPDDRLMWANSPTFPENNWSSKTSNYYNFNVSNPLVNSDALNLTLPSRQLNAISGLISLRAMLALTSSSEWSIESTQGVGNPLTPTTANQRVHGFEGAQAVRPVLIGNRSIFIQFLGKIVRDIGYELVYDSFVGANLSIFSNHLFFFNTIIDMAYQKNPDSMVWFVRDDGQLVSMTYLREQTVVSFARHDTDGNFLCVASLANSVRNYDEVWFVVNRENGQFIEYLSQRMITTTCNDGETNINISNQVFLDSTTIYGSNLVLITNVTVISSTLSSRTIVTAPNHGFSNGNIVRFSEMTEFTSLNNNSYTVSNVTTNTFDITVI